MKVKCQICGNKIEKETAYCITHNGKNKYYCNKEEYENNKREKDLRNSINSAMTQTLGPVLKKASWVELSNTISSLEQLYTLEQINEYLWSESESISHILLQKTFTSEWSKVRYYTAVIKNNIGDYYILDTIDVKPQIKIQENFYMPPENKYKPKKRRRSMVDFENDEDV